MNYSGSVSLEFVIYRPSSDPQEDEQEIILQVKGRSYYRRGRTYGDPYDCYPDEGDTEIISVLGSDNQDWYNKLTEDEKHDLELSIDEAVRCQDGEPEWDD